METPISGRRRNFEHISFLSVPLTVLWIQLERKARPRKSLHSVSLQLRCSQTLEVLERREVLMEYLFGSVDVSVGSRARACNGTLAGFAVAISVDC